MNDKHRAHSASSLKSLYLHSTNPKWAKRQTRSTPELRLYVQQSMLSGLNTTVPQSIVPQELSNSHKPKSRLNKGNNSCGQFCRDWCSLRLVLVTFQLLIGAGITAVSLYMYFFITKSLKVRETPYWAGIPLFVAGTLGMYHCAIDYEPHIRSSKHFIIQAGCFLLSVICIFVCLVASAFPAIHLGRLPTYKHCETSANDCHCYDSESRLFSYDSIGTCETVFCFVKIVLISECVMCILGSLISFWFVVLLWRSKYGMVNAGVNYSLANTSDNV